MMPHQRNRGCGNEKPRCRRQDVEPQKERDAPSQDLVLSHHPIHSAPGDFSICRGRAAETMQSVISDHSSRPVTA